jgi:hypothetical protein
VPEEAGRFAGETGEDALGHILGLMRVAVDLTKGGGINQVDVPFDQFLERGIRVITHITPEKFTISHVHLMI